jgi:hypothetical protein
MMNWNELGMLCEWDINNTLVRKYTYSDFERYCCECITPSMYHFMASYVLQHAGERNVDMAAVNSYFNLPIETRIDMHEQELTNLNWQKERVNIMLDTSDDEYEIHSLMEELAHFSKEIHEEAQWSV